MESYNNHQDLTIQVQQLKEQQDDLLRKNKALEEEFGLKRAQFMDMYYTKEEESKYMKSQVEALQTELQQIRNCLQNTEDELNGVKTAAAISEQENENAISGIRRQYESQMESLREIAKNTKATCRTEYEEERAKLFIAMEKLELELNELRGNARKQFTAPLMADFTSKIKRRTSQTKGVAPNSNETLEDSMEKAQQNAEMLRSVVIPMEEEIATLKSKLRDTQNKLRHYESKGSKSANLSEVLINLQENSEGAREEVKGLQSCLTAERSSRTDLEMYVAVLRTQKAVLQEDKEKLQDELKRVYRLLENEKMAESELKQTWRLANDGFLERQKSLEDEMDCMKLLMSPQQQQILQEMLQKKGESLPFPFEMTGPNSSVPAVEHVTTVRRNNPFAEDALERPKATGIMISCETETKSVNNNQSPPSDTKKFTSSSSVGNLIDLAFADSHNKLGPAASLTSITTSSEISPSDTIKRVQSDINITSDDVLRNVNPFKAVGDSTLPTDNGTVTFMTTAELQSLTRENKQLQEKLSKSEALCDNYEVQLQKCEKEITTLKDDCGTLISELEEIKNQTKADRQKYLTTDKKIRHASDTTDELIAKYCDKQNELNELYSSLEESFMITQKQVASGMKDLSASKAKISSELSALKLQYAELKKQLRGNVNADNTTLTAQVESKYQNEIDQLKQQMAIERSNAKANENKLRREIDYLTQEMASYLLVNADKDPNTDASKNYSPHGISDFDPFATKVRLPFDDFKTTVEMQDGDIKDDETDLSRLLSQFAALKEKKEQADSKEPYIKQELHGHRKLERH